MDSTDADWPWASCSFLLPSGTMGLNSVCQFVIEPNLRKCSLKQGLAFVTSAGLELPIFPLPPPKCQDCRLCATCLAVCSCRVVSSLKGGVTWALVTSWPWCIICDCSALVLLLVLGYLEQKGDRCLTEDLGFTRRRGLRQCSGYQAGLCRAL